jgi:tetratricopeptide (TPR) repeat protein
MVLVVGPRPARSEHPSAKVKAESDNEKLGPLIEGLGTHEHQIATDKPLAQKYFDQGLRLIFAFNHDEAIRAFRSAAKVDPNAAMAQWGIALALGPNYNLAADPERSKAAYEASRLAQKLAAKTSPREAAYADALAQRYAESPDAERKPLDQAYADAMRKLAAQYPDNLDAAVLFAEALMDVRPWDLWTHDGHRRDRRHARARARQGPQPSRRQPFLYPRRRSVAGARAGTGRGRPSGWIDAGGGAHDPHAGTHLPAAGAL